MRALQWHGPRDVRLVDIDTPRVGPGEVRIAVAYCGICGSDLHEYADGPHAIPVDAPHPLSGRTAPLTLGHEFCGTVVEVGAGVTTLRAGDRVAVEPEYRCQRCAYCRAGSYNLCVSMGFAGLMGDGGMADFAVVPAYMLHRLPEGVTLEQAAVLEPAAVALHALRRGELRLGNTCAVFGLGPIGLLLIMLAKLQGATTIVAVYVSPQRLAAAKRFGATHAFDARSLDAAALRDAIRAETGGLGVDVAFEAAGLPATFEAAMHALRKGGRVVMVGLMPHAGFDAFRAVNDELTFTASVGYRHAYDDLLRIVASGALDPASIVTRTVSLEHAIADGFDALLADRTQIKILVSPALGASRRAYASGSIEHEPSADV
ncbi:Sorbitol dehydrogenase [Burkholderia multivorans]|uniref:2,3-butanediol dehydrogenase n=1 Tax=Burkholderia multivorans TaxID=87883 RepID=UPI0028646EE7|nr:2,3-butanediol dehydrogenase [Burkholderia multivorans]MDR9059719.1 Sorbitol dehydrogenase [Burkholderia multivorans]MDR9071456.1 Sorbitol dehydrogenase [Burkholderia multivorans]MDR9083357.1 Sorbitol dehydrogenase [Burkholderia multivorans]MDR9101577.1 Sorbitol dehydrogenase [Burkholderia multivorans]MDR9106481.1 Sorbitol dehydrogenase [Burkholderia multivorans]